MSSFINTNIASMVAQNNLNTSQSSLQTAMQRLSSGLRINSAKDDAAGLAISQRMTSQLGGQNQAARNANDGISLAQTAEGDLSQIGSNLQRIRDLAVQAANGTNSASDRAALNNEASQLISEINRVASTSNFNGVNLLDGSFSNQTFQVGANGTSNDQITIGTISSAKSSALGVGSGSSYTSSLASTATATDAVGAGSLVLNGVSIGGTASDGVSFKNGTGSAIAKAAAINQSTGSTGITATAQANVIGGTTATTFAALAAGDIKINGVDIGAIAGGTAVPDHAAAVAAAINKVSTQSGVTATYDTTSGAVSLNAADGRNITIEKSGNAGANDVNTGLTTGFAAVTAGVTTIAAKLTLTSTNSNGIQVANGAQTQVVGGAAATVSTNLVAGDLTINGFDIGAVKGAATLSQQGQNVADAINAITSKTGVSATTSAAGIIKLTSLTGASITTVATANGLAGSGFAAATTTTAAGASTAATSVGLSLTAVTATTTVGAGLSSLDLSSASGATSALATIDAALSSVNGSRASLGAFQNRFTSAVTSLQTSQTNLAASRSRIQDADFASETANMTRAQVLQQAGTAILAQANQQPNGVLALLR
ncbi:flagellin [Undibacterium jejuense]|uniref:Flagellin n=1 Tax=Undibacterium jejuense TaxID=1344949 RepID=A0A923HEU1_9BURK|nr:flagellin [Undibacterium jejuense]MBC3861745.1 flagellin [Undibacterium jejuense]